MAKRARKFLCDKMCAELGRWLRTAGFDTVIIDTDLSDPKIYKMAIDQRRLLFTKDRYLMQLDPKRKIVVYLTGDSLDEWANQLRDEEDIDWLYRPFSRCLHCNSLLEKTTQTSALPEQIKENIKEFWSCPDCHQIFWLGSHTERMLAMLTAWQKSETTLTIGLCGDLMIGRLVDDYLDNHSPSYIWGNLLPTLSKMDLNIINLETTLTQSKKTYPKVFNFKAHPKNVSALAKGHIHAVNVANNHILDFSEEGLLETLQTLDETHILHVGAGRDLLHAREPAILEKKGIRIGLLGCTDNEPGWKAGAARAGTNFVEIGDIEPLRESIITLRKQVDIVILSMHWGPNMQRRPSSHFRAFAHALIDLGVDILHGHSAHVFQGVEIYKQKLILYDTGDFVDDYAVDPVLRNDLSFFFVIKTNKKKLLSLKMIPTAISEFQVNLFHEEKSLDVMEELCKELGTHTIREKGLLYVQL